MPSYIVLREVLRTHRSDLVKRLLELGYVRIHRGLWVAPGRGPAYETGLLGEPQVLVLRTSRALRRPHIDEERGVYDLGSLILIAYRLPEDARIRKAVSRLIRRAPCFKLAPSVYMFPQVNYNRYRGEKSVLLTPDVLMKKIIVFGGEVHYIPKVTLASSSSAKSLIEELREGLARRGQKMLQSCLRVNLGGEPKPAKRISELKTDIKALRELLNFYEREMGLSPKPAYTDLRRAIKILKEAKKAYGA
ncbi:MAG: hypothetical protein ACE5Z5_12715 [Candidatus Bathyarchaeia archaeon]